MKDQTGKEIYASISAIPEDTEERRKLAVDLNYETFSQATQTVQRNMLLRRLEIAEAENKALINLNDQQLEQVLEAVQSQDQVTSADMNHLKEGRKSQVKLMTHLIKVNAGLLDAQKSYLESLSLEEHSDTFADLVSSLKADSFIVEIIEGTNPEDGMPTRKIDRRDIVPSLQSAMRAFPFADHFQLVAQVLLEEEISLQNIPDLYQLSRLIILHEQDSEALLTGLETRTDLSEISHIKFTKHIIETLQDVQKANKYEFEDVFQKYEHIRNIAIKSCGQLTEGDIDSERAKAFWSKIFAGCVVMKLHQQTLNRRIVDDVHSNVLIPPALQVIETAFAFEDF